MSKLTEALSALNIHNNHNLLSRFGEARDVWVDYSPTDKSRGGRWAHSNVMAVGFKTDPAAHWQDYGSKSFHGTKDVSLPLALAWASEQYGIAEWAVSPFGGRIPAHVLKRAKEAAKAKAPAAP